MKKKWIATIGSGVVVTADGAIVDVKVDADPGNVLAMDRDEADEREQGGNREREQEDHKDGGDRDHED